MSDKRKLREKIAYANLRVDKGYLHRIFIRSIKQFIKNFTAPFTYLHNRYGINCGRNANFALKKYDEMAGEYRRQINQRNDKSTEEFLVISDDNLKPFLMKQGEYYEKIWDYFAREIESYQPKSILEVGAGEFTTLTNLLKILGKRRENIQASGLDISWSRVAYGKKYAKEVNEKIEDFVVGDMFALPFPDNSYDLVYTSSAIEQSPNDNERAIKELYRVARKVVILFEPSYEFGSKKQKKRHKRLDYPRDFPKAINKLGYLFVKHEPAPISLYNYRLGTYVIEKGIQSLSLPIKKGYLCPKCNNDLSEVSSLWSCSFCGIAYPVLLGIPCLDVRNSILTSKLGELI